MLRRLTVLVLFFLAGCSPSLVQLQKIEPVGTPFQMYLAREYLDFSEAEANQYDWFDSAHFARKGLILAKGHDAEPEQIKYWDIPEADVPTLEQARGYLMDTLTPEIKDKYPKEAAKTQYYFDCWVEQSEESWQDDHIAYCREHFYKELDQLYAFVANDEPMELGDGMTPEEPAALPEDGEVVADGAMGGGAKKMAVYPPLSEKTENGGEVTPYEPENDEVQLSDYSDKAGPRNAGCQANCVKTVEKRILYFDFNSAAVNKRAQRVVSSLIEELKNTGRYAITVNGYADRIGSESANLKLSKARAAAVKKLFMDAGMKDEDVTIFAFGEVHGLLDTKDGVAEEENRAVEVVIER